VGTPRLATSPPAGSGGFPLDHLSASSITLFKRCPRQWQQRYLIGERGPSSAALIVGSAVHGALNYKALGTGNFDLAWNEALEDSLLKSDGTIDWSRMSPEKAREQAEHHYNNYLRFAWPYLGEIVNSEQEISIIVPGVDIPVIGFIDLETEFKVIDYKTTGYFNRKPSLNPEWAFQLAVYQLKVPKPGEIHVLTRGDKYPVYMPNSADDPLYRPYAGELVSKTFTMIADAYELMQHFWAVYGVSREWPGNETQEWGHKYCSHPNCCAMERW
jgi:hypothetical protein